MPHTDRDGLESADILSRDEIAAVQAPHEVYVNDVPSPYLSERQAAENVTTTRRRHTVISTILVFILIGSMVAAAGWYVWETIKPPVSKPVPQFNTAPIEHKEFVDSVDATTIILPIDEQPVITHVSGTITEAMVEDGAYVEEGDVLYTLENPTVTDTLEKAKTALDVAQEDVDMKSATLDEAKKALEKQQNQGDSAQSTSSNSSTTDSSSTSAKGQTSSSNTNATLLTAADARVQAAQKDLDDANARLDSIQEMFDRAQEQVDRLTVYAPISGTLHDINAAYGPTAEIGGTEQLAVISDYSAFLVREEIPLERIGQIQEGLEARLTFPAVRDLYLYASVSSITESNNGATQIANVEIENPDERLSANMACNVAIVVQSIPDSFVIPIEAIAIKPDDPSVGEISLMIDVSRGIKTNILVSVVATSATEAAIVSPNIQEGSSVVILPTTSTEAEQPAPAPAEPQEQTAEEQETVEPGQEEPSPEGEENPEGEANPEGEPAPSEAAPEGDAPQEEGTENTEGPKN